MLTRFSVVQDATVSNKQRGSVIFRLVKLITLYYVHITVRKRILVVVKLLLAHAFN